MSLYLDIETDFQRNLTVIGFYERTHGFFQLIGSDITKARLMRELPKTAKLFTFNGHSFDWLCCIKMTRGVLYGSLAL